MGLSAFLVALTVILSLSLVQVVGASTLIIENVDASKNYSGNCCYTIVGDVYNAGPTDSYGVSVTAAFYGTGGVIWVSSTMTADPFIPVGQSSQFVFQITNDPQIVTQIASYQLTVSES
jgi:hypothetical protein